MEVIQIPPRQIKVENRITIVTPWLFGTFVADYPSQILAGQKRKVEVTFTPAVFSGDVQPNLSIRPASYAGPTIPDTLRFEPRDVSGSQVQKFQLGQWAEVDPKGAIKWSWEANPSSDFKNADFQIIMEAAERVGSEMTVPKKAADLPVQIGLEPEKSWWERHDALVAAIVGAVLGVLGTPLFTRLFRT